ncbi:MULTISPECIES: ribosome maturation factor RimP [unclassified Luteococcus]|uniref:ribosome maturation factor RimP n=1 Tax=unclassified Luteococcus TaxID=2639923 RepID=UPI00313BF0EC
MQERVVKPIIMPILEAHGLELDNLDIIPAGKRKVLRITVDGDGPKGRGPLLDDIATATRDISDALDEAPELGQAPFTLEVSSRGVGKPLEEPKHFRRNTGRLVLVVLIDGGTVRGRITQTTDTEVTLTVEAEPGKKLPKDTAPVRVLGFDEITKATVQVEMNRKHDPELDEIGDDSDETEDDDFEDDDESDHGNEEN